MDWSESTNFWTPPEKLAHTKEAVLHNKLPENKNQYALVTEGSYHVMDNRQRWNTAVWSPTRQVRETIKKQKSKLKQFTKVKVRYRWTRVASTPSLNWLMYGCKRPTGLSTAMEEGQQAAEG